MNNNSEGIVYLMKISSENRDWVHTGELFKIGQTTNLKSRLSQMRSKFGERVDIVACAKVGDKLAAEKKLLERFCEYQCTEPLGIELLHDQELFLFDDKTCSKVIISLWRLGEYYPYQNMKA